MGFHRNQPRHKRYRGRPLPSDAARHLTYTPGHGRRGPLAGRISRCLGEPSGHLGRDLEGDDIVSRINALKTGLTGRTVLLPSEHAALYEAHLAPFRERLPARR